MPARLLAAFLLIGLLAGCSAVRIAYNQADHMVAWRADDYFDFSAEQKSELAAGLSSFHTWHRATQLVDYAALLDAAQRRLDNGVEPADVAWAMDAMRVRYRALVERGYRDAARLLATLSDAQLDTARRRFERDNRKFAREFGAGASAEEQYRLRARRQLDRIEHWTGSLSTSQRTQFDALSRALPLVTDLRLDDRLRRQREFLALLETHRKATDFPARLRAWLLDWDRTRTPEHQRALERFLEANARMYVELYALLTPDQRRRVSDRLQRYATAFRDLAGDAPRTAGVTP